MDDQLYKDQGYLLPEKPLFSEEKFKALSDIFEEHLASSKDKKTGG